jgi:hypothetical protein
MPWLATVQVAALVVAVSGVVAWLAWVEPNALLMPRKAVLVEAPAAAGQPPTPLDATAVWRYFTDGAEVVAEVTVPARELTVTLTFRRNTDASLPASHIIEVATHTPSGFPGGGVADVGGLALKPAPTAEGQLLAGSVAKIDDGTFWIGLSSDPSDGAKNLALLRTEGFLGLPIVFDSGKRATLIFEKGASGERALKQAILAWTR